MYKYFLYLTLIYISYATASDVKEINEGFFSNPQVTSSEKKISPQSTEMIWEFEKNTFFYFLTEENKIFFEIQIDTIPEYFDTRLKSLFIKKSISSIQGEQIFYAFSYEWQKSGGYIINKSQTLEKEKSVNSPSYLLDKRRVFRDSKPQSIDENQILTIIRNHRVLFYTGAGISIAAGIPSMSQLNDLMGFQKELDPLFAFKKMVENPEEFSKKIETFHNACVLSKPTDAHKALKKLALLKNTKIATENLDYLHEYSGIIPCRINAEILREAIESSQLSPIDYIICIGLSYDDKGFLGWYKRNHPEGKIISIDLENPSYLGDEDFIIRADLQCLIPSLANQLIPELSEKTNPF